MADAVASGEGSDAKRVAALFNRVLGEETISLSPPIQMLCDAMIEGRPDFLLAVNAQGTIQFASGACSELVGVGAQTLEGEAFETLLDVQDRPDYRQFFADTILPLAGQSFSRLGPLDLRIAPVVEEQKSPIRWVALRVSSIDLPPDAGSNVLFFFSLIDITQREEEEGRIRQQLNFDSMTGLPSRYNLIAQVEEHIESNQASRDDAPFVFVFFDLDRFKNINDALGHRIGDEFLASLCRRLQGSFEDNQIFARFGGDEFILFLPEIADLDEASDLCLSTLDLMREPTEVAGYSLSCGASFGLARYPDHGSTIDELIQTADTAMYHVKSLGTGGCAVFEASMKKERFSQLELEQELRQALIQGDFVTFYQPIVELATGTLAGVEALARWRHVRLGLLEPAAFMTLAEHAGLVPDIDALVQTSALQRVAHWRTLGHDLVLSINCASAQIERPDFIQEIESLCAEADFPLERLQIEVTEQTLVRQVELAAANIQALRAKGVKVAIDDFGMGYSSLNYLHQFPVDVLKIDQTFIQEIQTQSDAKAGVSLADAIIAMAKGLGLTVIGEGVERSAQLDYLCRQGCDQAQGFLFSAPCDEQRMLSVLAQGGYQDILDPTALTEER